MYDVDEPEIARRDFMAGQTYVANKQRRMKDKFHWHWEIFIPLSQTSRAQWDVLSINAHTNKVDELNSSKWNSFLIASKFVVVPRKFAIMALFGEDNSSWISYVF